MVGEVAGGVVGLVRMVWLVVSLWLVRMVWLVASLWLVRMVWLVASSRMVWLVALALVVVCLCRCCVRVGVRWSRLWGVWVSCGLGVWMSIGVVCWVLLVVCVWGCRRMRFSVSGFGLGRVWVWVM